LEDNPVRNISRYAWGEKFDPNKMRYQYEGKNWETGLIVRTPFVYKDDWFTGIFQTGLTTTNVISVNGSNGEGTNVRFSVTNTDNDWILPNTGYKRSITIEQTVIICLWLAIIKLLSCMILCGVKITTP